MAGLRPLMRAIGCAVVGFGWDHHCGGRTLCLVQAMSSRFPLPTCPSLCLSLSPHTWEAAGNLLGKRGRGALVPEFGGQWRWVDPPSSRRKQ
eukprot:191273-Chlamydomonas_euryale.AAC.1